jgi:hypothetical protein
MNFQPSATTTVHQAILIRHGHNYFENGQTRRIKNLSYSLMPVDHNAIIRKTLLRKGEEVYRALTVFSELISIATRRPQRGLVADAQGPITAERITGATGMNEPDVRVGYNQLKERSLIGSHVWHATLSALLFKGNWHPPRGCPNPMYAQNQNSLKERSLIGSHMWHATVHSHLLRTPDAVACHT